MKRCLFLLLLLLTLSSQALLSQTNTSDPLAKSNWSIFWNGSFDISSDRFNANDFTFQGFGTKFNYKFNDKIGLEAKFSYRYWNDYDRTVVPLAIGPNYTLLNTNKINLRLRSVIGPELLIGNDYASIFLGFEIGPEILFEVNSRHAFIIGAAFAQAMTGHPDHFEYLDFMIGYQF